jgi:hypothetical protein
MDTLAGVGALAVDGAFDAPAVTGTGRPAGQY